jgi:hypothetical protein
MVRAGDAVVGGVVDAWDVALPWWSVMVVVVEWQMGGWLGWCVLGGGTW